MITINGRDTTIDPLDKLTTRAWQCSATLNLNLTKLRIYRCERIGSLSITPHNLTTKILDGSHLYAKVTFEVLLIKLKRELDLFFKLDSKELLFVLFSLSTLHYAAFYLSIDFKSLQK